MELPYILKSNPH